MFVLFHCRSKGGSKPYCEKKSHEHGTNQSTHLSFIETCKQLGNSATDFVEFRQFRHRLWGNQHRLWANKPSTFGKAATNFGKNSPVTNFGKICHQLWGNHVTDFEEVSLRFWGNASPILGKSVADFGDISHRLWGKIGSVLGKFGEIGLVFGLACDKAQVSLSWTPSMFGFGCHYKGKTAGGKLEG